MIFGNPCPATGLRTYCGFTFKILKPISWLSPRRRCSSTWSRHRKRHPTAEQLADQLKNSFLLFYFTLFVSHPFRYNIAEYTWPYAKQPMFHDIAGCFISFDNNRPSIYDCIRITWAENQDEKAMATFELREKCQSPPGPQRISLTKTLSQTHPEHRLASQLLSWIAFKLLSLRTRAMRRHFRETLTFDSVMLR
jgi:hypothetical protein